MASSQNPQSLKAWVGLLAVVMAAGAFVQTNRTTAAIAAQALTRIEAQERTSERAAELQRQTVDVLVDLKNRMRENEIGDAKDSERLAQIRAELDRILVAVERTKRE